MSSQKVDLMLKIQRIVLNFGDLGLSCGLSPPIRNGEHEYQQKRCCCKTVFEAAR